MRSHAQPEDVSVYGTVNPLTITFAITWKLIRNVATNPRIELLKRIGDAREDST